MGLSKPKGAMKVNVGEIGDSSLRITGSFYSFVDGAKHERTCWDPKDGELWLARTKPEETLVEVRSDSDVQIDRQSRL